MDDNQEKLVIKEDGTAVVVVPQEYDKDYITGQIQQISDRINDASARIAFCDSTIAENTTVKTSLESTNIDDNQLLVIWQTRLALIPQV